MKLIRTFVLNFYFRLASSPSGAGPTGPSLRSPLGSICNYLIITYKKTFYVLHSMKAGFAKQTSRTPEKMTLCVYEGGLLLL